MESVLSSSHVEILKREIALRSQAMGSPALAVIASQAGIQQQALTKILDGKASLSFEHAKSLLEILKPSEVCSAVFMRSLLEEHLFDVLSQHRKFAMSAKFFSPENLRTAFVLATERLSKE